MKRSEVHQAIAMHLHHAAGRLTDDELSTQLGAVVEEKSTAVQHEMMVQVTALTAAALLLACEGSPREPHEVLRQAAADYAAGDETL